jgi:hypothetical protein
MKYKLKSGLASYEGERLGSQEFIMPVTRKAVEAALKEALEDLADKSARVSKLRGMVDILATQGEWSPEYKQAYKESIRILAESEEE